MNTAGTPLKLTDVASEKSSPVSVVLDPALPKFGIALTNGGTPRETV